MGNEDRDPITSLPTSPEAHPVTTPVSATAETGTAKGRAGWRLWSAALLGGLVAGLISWGVGQYTQDSISTDAEYESAASRLGQVPQKEVRHEARTMIELKKSALWYGIQGAVLGMTLGLAGGLSRSSWARALLAGLLGLVLGGVFAGGSAYKVVPLLKDYWFEAARADLGTTIQNHLAGWLPAGLIGGLAFGLGLGGFRRILGAVTGGILGAALGTVVNEIVVSLAFPLVATTRHVDSTWYLRLVACLILALSVAACVVVGARERARVPAEPAV